MGNLLDPVHLVCHLALRRHMDEVEYYIMFTSPVYSICFLCWTEHGEQEVRLSSGASVMQNAEGKFVCSSRAEVSSYAWYWKVLYREGKEIFSREKKEPCQEFILILSSLICMIVLSEIKNVWKKVSEMGVKPTSWT